MNVIHPDFSRSLHPTSGVAGALRIGLVNNMADAALRKTEQQFRSLLGAEGVQLVLTGLAGLPRSEPAARHIAETYLPLAEALQLGLDAVIVTGAEPRTAELADEAYWPAMTGLFDWISRTGTPAAYCCLAAHAAVLHRDGIRRRPLQEKCFGVFDHDVLGSHRLVDGVTPRHPVPHSRWNGVDPAELQAAGYRLLTAASVGVGGFARGGDLFFQGHPEYTGTSLLREYRRDVRRFLTGERATYPQAPAGTLQGASLDIFAAFQSRAIADRRQELMEVFPAFPVSDARQSPWRLVGAQIYRNWLDMVAEHAETAVSPELVQAAE